jgi:tryptophan synthase alpha chain
MDNRIDIRLQQVKAAGETVVAPFVTVGFPDVEMSISLAAAVLQSGGDLLELGVPFSDPLADGATIQKTSFRALQNRVNLRTSLDLVRRLRGDGVDAPLILMGYFNPFLRYGLEKFASDAAEAGVDGLIVPDLPPEEAGPFKRMCEDSSVYIIPLIAPTSTDSRIAQACKDAKGFIYCVSLAGVTGARKAIRTGVAPLVGRIRQHTDLPVLVGFGISRREHVEEVGRFADGVVVASALLDAIDRAPIDQIVQTGSDFVAALKGVRVDG